MKAFQIEFRRDVPGGVENEGDLALLGWRIKREGDWAAEVDESGSGTLVTSHWPEPASLRIEWDSQAILIIPDHASVATVFYRTDGGDDGSVVVSTDFGRLLQGREARIRPEAIEECTLLGHVLGSGTIVDSVDRVTQGQALRLAADGSLMVVSDDRSCPLALEPDPSAILNLPDSPQFKGMESAAIEMTGGLDSRLSLAMLLAAARPPRHACTFGVPDSIDVRIARDLSQPFGIEHHVLQLQCEGTEPLDLACRHVLCTGGLLSFTKYAPLMSELLRASSFRDSQVSGLGGELAINFYQVSGLDSMVRRGRFDEVIRHRVVQVPPSLSRLRERGVFEAASRVAGRIAEVLKGYPVETEEALRWFYSRERMNNWAFVGLNANRHEYGLRLPLLSRNYLQWSNSLSSANRQDRRGQFELLRTLSGRIDGGEALLGTKVAGARGFRRVLNHAKKLFLRATAGADPRSDADTSGVLRCAVEDERLRSQLQRLSETKVFGRRFTIEDLHKQAASGDMLVGMFVTAAATLDCAERGPR